MRRGMAVGITMLLALASAPADAGRGAGILLPPAAIDVGGSVPLAEAAGAGPSLELRIGLHWASLAWRPTPIELGFGYVGSFRAIDPGQRGVATRTTTRAPALGALQGGYITLGRTIYDQRHFRTWISVRGELLAGTLTERTRAVIGGAIRLGTELYRAGHVAANRPSGVAIVAGTVAFGVFVEASYRDLPAALGPSGLTTGLSIRIPFVLAGAI